MMYVTPGTPLDERPKNCAWCLREHIGDEHMTDPQHGAPGHIGFRCPICAAESPNAVLIETTSGDAWQTKQIKWQEACDVVYRQFDDDNAAHWKEHKARDCLTCPVIEDYPMPVKPQMPLDRVNKQLSRVMADDFEYAD